MKSAITIKSRSRRGAVAILFPVVLTVLVAVGALALNLTWLSSHQAQLRQACEAGALAGAAVPVRGGSGRSGARRRGDRGGPNLFRRQ
jgi:Flp pilus assembly protein TadG